MTEQKRNVDELRELESKAAALRKKRNQTKAKTAKAEDGDAKTPSSSTTSASQPDNVEFAELPERETQTIRDIAAQVEDVIVQMQDAARESPTVALLAAFGVGVAVGQLLSGR